MPSFSIEIKNEIAKIEETRSEKIAELSAIVRLNYKNEKELEIITENASIARRVFSFMKDLYGIHTDVDFEKIIRFNKKTSYHLDILEKRKFILEDLSIISDKGNFITKVKEYIIDDEEEKRAYLRGCFLACGSLNDPKLSRYHLEFLVKREEDGLLIEKLLNKFNLNSKMIHREKGYMVYVKEAEKIGDFLRVVGARSALLYYEDIRIYRDYKNMNNRLNNCEQANIEKTVNTANNQLDYIKTIKENDGYEILDSKLKEAVTYREKYKESSLQELSEIITKETGHKIGKSGLNHRFRKIKEIANNYSN